MKNSIRCCISCILPCGALDVIRIVHSNGRVQEFSQTIRACEVMKENPKHVLRKSSSPSESDNSVVPKIVIVPPDAELQRGKIYFLMPVSSPEKTQSRSTVRRRRRREQDNNGSSMMTKLLVSDQYLSEILSEKISTQRDQRRGRVGVWRPHLESISEMPSDL